MAEKLKLRTRKSYSCILVITLGSFPLLSSKPKAKAKATSWASDHTPAPGGASDYRAPPQPPAPSKPPLLLVLPHSAPLAASEALPELVVSPPAPPPTLSALHLSPPVAASAPQGWEVKLENKAEGPSTLRKDSILPLPLAGTKSLHFGSVSAFFGAT